MSATIMVGPLEIRFVQSRHDTAGALDLFEITVPPDARMPVPHRHSAWEETIYGLEGTTVWTVGGATVEIGAGASVFIPRNVVHGFGNRSGAPARCLCVLTPGVIGPEYFQELGAALAGPAPPDPAALRAIMMRHGFIPEPG